MIRQKLLPVRKREYLLPLAVMGVLLVSCIYVSRKKYFWFDEFLSCYMLRDGSFPHILRAFHDQINNTPVLYFLTGWVWSRLFGASELSLRLFSCAGICVGFTATWFTLRRTYPFWVSTLGAAGVFCTSSIILSQNAEARMYGLFVAVCALALYVYNRLYEQLRPSVKWLLINTGVHIAVLHTHLYGIFYSAAILLCFLAADRYYKLFRPALYASVVAAWLSWLLYLPSFLVQAAVGKPRSWLPVPLFSDLVSIMDFSDGYFVTPLVIFLIVAAAIFLSILKTFTGRLAPLLTYYAPARYTEAPLVIFGCAFLLVPVATWIISRMVRPIFWDRYLIPSALGWSIVLAFICRRIVPAPAVASASSSGLRYRLLQAFRPALLLALTMYLLVQPLLYARRLRPQQQPGLHDDAYGYVALPVVVLSAQSFLEKQYYSPAKDRYYFILDWQAASGANSGAWAPQEYKHLAALKRNYPASFEHVVASADFLRSHPRFLVIGYADTAACPLVPYGLAAARNWKGMHCPQWMNMRLNEGYTTTLLGRDEWNAVWLVEKKLKEL